MKENPLTQSSPVRGACLLVRRYLRHNVGMQSAALAFYLLFMIFPFLIFISALLGLLELDVKAILQAVDEILPREVLALVEVYLTHVAAEPSPKLLLFGLLFSIYFPMRATNALLRAVRTAYHLGPPRSTLRHWVKTLLYTALLISAIALTLTLMTVGERWLWYGVDRFGLPVFLAELWVRLRVPAAALAGSFALFFLYALAQDSRQPLRNLWPGAAAGLLGWLTISLIYSYYVNYVAHYSALYGSIGAIIVVLIWLYLSAIALIMGAEVNGMLISLRRGKGADTE